MKRHPFEEIDSRKMISQQGNHRPFYLYRIAQSRNLSKINLESGLAIDGPDESSVGLVERMVLEKSRNYETQSEICLYSVECELVLYLARIKGKIEVTTSNLRFIPDNSIFLKKEGENDMNVHLEELKAVAEHHRPLSSLTKVFYRKYNLQDSAIEAFFNDGQNFMFNFLGTGKEAEKQDSWKPKHFF